ncbi:MAG: AMP-binding protein [Alphaproteobacteria bacterium]|nr:AMP-binding protein [Alphaproteobacteria bacterium]
MNLAAWLTRAGKALGESPALGIGGSTVRNYREMARRVAVLAGAMRDRLGLRPGDRVAFTMKNCPDYVEVLFAAWHAGLAAVPINAKLHASEFTYILENSGARVVFATADLSPVIGSIAVEGVERAIEVGSPEYAALFEGDPAPLAQVEPTDVAWLFYTSGTTGQPKGAMLTHRVLTAMTLSYFADVDTIDPADCILHAAPMSHGSGLYILPHVLRGACNVIPESGGFEPDEMFDLMDRWRGMAIFAAPTMVKRLTDFPEDRDSAGLKSILYGGGPMYVADAQAALDRFGPKLVQIYGQGESPMTITYLGRDVIAARDHPRWVERLGSVGVAQSVVEVRVADDRDFTLPPGETGEVLVRGDSVMPGYWRNPEATAATLANGWLHTGDVGAMDEEGFLTLKDRSKDVIISGGTNIYPREVEEVLLRHPGVAEVSVIGRPDAEWGETVVAYVVARGDAPAPEDLDGICLDAIARFKRPRDYRFVDALPKNNYGKVLKTALRERDAE